MRCEIAHKIMTSQPMIARSPPGIETGDTPVRSACLAGSLFQVAPESHLANFLFVAMNLVVKYVVPDPNHPKLR